jgi:sugar O-acyltransferase (sialic acid O-acetyltransferase NeuD family)
MDITPIVVPLINPNEPEAVVAALHVREGEYVANGVPLCTLETTKSTNEVTAEVGGFVVGLRFQVGQPARAGETLCHIAPSMEMWEARLKEKKSDAESSSTGDGQGKDDLPPGLRITKPALELARRHGIDLCHLPGDVLVTQKVVEQVLSQSGKEAVGLEPVQFTPPEPDFDATAIVIYGGGGHGKALIDLVRAMHTYHVIGIIDDGAAAGEHIMDLQVLGNASVLAELRQRGVRLAVNAVGGIGDVSTRLRVFKVLHEAGFVCPALVHPRAYVEPSAVLAPGVQVFAFAYVGSETKVGYGSIINTGAIISHECALGNAVNISPGATLAGQVTVGDGTLIGMQATINLRVKVGQGVRIGNGATVKSDVPDRGVVRAGTIFPL